MARSIAVLKNLIGRYRATDVNLFEILDGLIGTTGDYHGNDIHGGGYQGGGVLPEGGSEGDVLVKNSDENYDAIWVDPSQVNSYYDSPLSDGDLVDADLIYADGECIIVQVPV